ncbi:GNAT family N-acetyltransferase [Brucella tritici]|uniref:GNAT family N-acetyltransferase n=1 Tax=Brucella tritici TaxID=94626 RepID=A0A7V8B165_9HYPH|nr:GNAT family N-acetyltransferase [Brucella tritici]KAB2655469.1 GNAT family N-acetyltransferase [Brucella tritici]
MVVEVLEEDCYDASSSERRDSYTDLSPGLKPGLAASLADDLSPDLAYELDCPVLVTERLVLRPPHVEDVDAISYLANNARVSGMLARMPHPYTRENAVDFVERVRKGEMGNCIYAITQAETGIFMGCCGIHAHKHGEGLEIGYWLGEPYWGHGFATEAAHALIDLAFRATAIERLHVSCRASNGGSRRVIHKCGFQFSSMGMADSLAAGNVPVERYVLDRRTWIGLRSWQS